MFHPTSGSQPKNSYELVGRRIKELIAALSVKKQNGCRGIQAKGREP